MGAATQGTERSRGGRPPAIFAFLALLFASLLASLPLAAQTAAGPFEIRDDQRAPILLRSAVRAVFEDATPLDPAGVARLAPQGRPHPASPPNFGRFDKPAWGHVTVVNRLPRSEWILTYSLGTVEDVRVYVRAAGEAEFRQLHEIGEDAFWPFSGFRSATFNLMLEPDRPIEIVTRLRTRAPIGFHLELSPAAAFFVADRQQIGFAGVLAGVPVAVLVYGAMLATVLRQRGLGSLMVLLASKLVVDSWISGLGRLIMPFIPRDDWPTVGFVAVAVLVIASVAHIRKFLDLGRAAPRADRALLALAAICFTLTAIELSGFANTRFLVQLMAPLILLAFTIMSALAAWRERSVGSAAYALAWAVFLSEALTQFLRLLALLPSALPTLTFAQSAIAALLFGVAIFRRMKDQDRALNQSLAESNERFRLAIDGSAAAIYDYSFAEDRFSYGPRLAELLGARIRQPVRHTIARLPRDSRRRLLEGLRDALAAKARRFRVEIAQGEDGAPSRVLAITGAIQYGTAQTPDRICGSVIDVTSDHALAVEKSLRAAVSAEKERAEHSLKARTLFYAAANHDLRHPLLSLGLYLQMLARDATLRKLRSFLPRMLEAHRSAFGYLDRIVELARVDAGEHAIIRKPQLLQTIFSRLADRYQADAARAGLKLRAAPTSAVVDTDEFLLERILSNLISNAIQNTKQGGVLVGCRRRAGGARIDVIDTGPGLPPDVRDRFVAGHLRGGAGESSDGLRLGLAIVQRMADELGCVVDIEARDGRGTRFSVFIPDGSAPREEAVAPAAATAEPA